MKNNPIILFLLCQLALTACTRINDDARRAAEADSLMTALSQQKDYERMALVADSLGHVGALRHGRSLFWQGFAAYRQQQRRTAEFFWQEAMDATSTSTDAADIDCYAEAASYLAGSLCRNADFSAVLKTVLPAANRLQQLGCDTTSNYSNLLIFIGCSQMHFGADESTIDTLFTQAYAMHLDNIVRNGTKDAYRDAVAGLINIAYGWIKEEKYEPALVWTDRFGQIVNDYRTRFQGDETYVDKQWARHLIFRATALAGTGRSREAAKAYIDYQNTTFAKTFEGLIDAAEYFTVARRWKETVLCYSDLDKMFATMQIDYSLENIQKFMLRKYQASTMSGQTDTATAVANRVCQLLDSAIIRSRMVDADEIETIRQKEFEMSQREIEMARLKLMNTIVAFVILAVVFAVFTFIRQRHARHLAEKNAQLAEKNEQMAEKNEQLRVANARAEESSHMKSVFIQQISHEIRTPLNILSGFTQVITTPDMELDNDTRSEINREITTNTERITQLVNKMLELSDANSQAVIARTDDVPALQIAAQATDASRITQAPHLTFDMRLTPEAEEAVLHTNLNAAVRALTLLLDNARKFTAPAEAQLAAAGTTATARQSVVLSITLSPAQPPQPQTVNFIVEDTGMGIPSSEAEHIFDEFVQLDDYYDGTGIGLTVARSLARRLGGDIRLDTTYTAGARFVLTLPAEP